MKVVLEAAPTTMPMVRSVRTHVLRRAAGRAVACSVIALFAVSAEAVLYKWVDANGRVSYSDQPPPSNVKAEVVSGAAVISAPDAVRDMASQEMDLKKRQAQRVDEQKKVEKVRADTALQQQACIELRGKIKIFESDQPIVRINEVGEQVFMDDTMRVRERERLEGTLRERCAG